MTLPSSGPLDMSMIAAEYGGGSGPYALSSYYRGGAHVRNISSNANIPTSGTINYSNFYGQSNTLITNHTLGVANSSQPGIVYGYSDGTLEGGAFGSMSPGTTNGIAIKLAAVVNAGPSSFKFEMALAGTVGPSAFQELSYLDHNFTIRHLLPINAEAYSVGPGGAYSYWRWPAGIVSPLNIGDSRTLSFTW